MRFAQLEICKSELNFSAGHFTIFSATERETMHGHNYSINVRFSVAIGDNGLAFDYRHYKQKIRALCAELDRYFLLPGQSRYLTIEDHEEYWHVYFNEQRLFFLKNDVVILPLTNITIEELAHWFLEKMVLEIKADLINYPLISALSMKVYNGPGQAGTANWEKESLSKIP